MKTEEKSYERINNQLDGTRGWVVTAACFMAAFLTDGITFCFGLILFELIQVFDEPVEKVAWIPSFLLGIQLLSGPLASALSNRFGFRVVIVSGSFLGFAGLTCSSFAPSVDVLFLTIGLMCGVAFGLVWTPAVVAVSYFENRRSLATGVVMCGSGMGTFVFAPFIYWLLENYALRGTFLILGALYLNCAAVGAFFRPMKRGGRNNKSSQHGTAITLKVMESKTTRDLLENSDPLIVSLDRGQPDMVVVEDSIVEEELRSTDLTSAHDVPKQVLEALCTDQIESSRNRSIFKFSLFRSPSFVLVCTSSFVQLLGSFVPYVYLTAYAIDVGISKEAASFLLSIVGVTNTVGNIAVGALTSHPKVSVLLTNNIALSLEGLLLIACPLFTTYGALVFFAVMYGLCSSCISVCRPILMGEMLGFDNVNNAFGFVLMFYGLASFIGIPLAGHLYGTYGDYHGTFYFAGSVVFIAGAICYPLACVNRKPSEGA
ncbi:monocarboxylate transporter 12-like [Daphnia pulex]|uniref:monocarboxylate transporter 12-like n=1 Tax=Daphnia pulex TaxID=6669 RepID=UPI001EDF7C43|nr:monocarboxylate transporter 12-like [Daphnia pulex]